ncbi:MAG: hypothetical protein LBN05_09015 [Oscillospiraceae bacterium]|jgi:hypothetical protein|nr:hypothetical protein [Oscillospiraceae bacterium]
MLKTAYRMGLTPAEFWALEMWEFIACAEAYDEQSREKAEQAITQAWMVAALVNPSIQGKLQKLDSYLPKTTPDKPPAPRLSDEEFDRRLARARAATEARKKEASQDGN